MMNERGKSDRPVIPVKSSNNAGIITLARGRWDGTALTDVRDIFSAIQSGNASRIVFGKDGMVYMTVGIGDPPAGGVSTVRGIVCLASHSSTLTITQTAMRAPFGNLSGGRLAIGE